MKRYLLLLVSLFISRLWWWRNKTALMQIPLLLKNVNKDQDTPAERGGYGFEAVANGLGFETYEWSKNNDGTYFGDPNAKKGGTFNYIHSLFSTYNESYWSK